jgi:hypothetical protein
LRDAIEELAHNLPPQYVYKYVPAVTALVEAGKEFTVTFEETSETSESTHDGGSGNYYERCQYTQLGYHVTITARDADRTITIVDDQIQGAGFFRPG